MTASATEPRRPSVPVIGTLAVAFGVLWIGGIATYLRGVEPPAHMRWTPMAFLLVAALIPFAVGGSKLRYAMLLAAAAGWIAEVIGLRTGLPFGEYRYTAALGPQVFGVPLVIGAAWSLLAAYAANIASALGPSKLQVLLAALWMVLLDMVLDPVATVALDFWHWQGDGAYYGVPLSNFAGWLLVGLIACLPFQSVPRSSPAPVVGLAVLIFFTLIAANRGLVMAAALGAGLVIAHAVVRFSRRSG